MKTKSAVLYRINSPLVIEEIDIPPLQAGQALVKVLASGICRSQLNEISGFKGPDHHLPHLMGHEGSGIVIDVGPGVKKVKKKDYVVLSWIKGSGRDVSSSCYQKGSAVINSGAIATFNEYAVIAENRLTKIPQDVPPDVAALLGCAVPTGAGIVLNTLKVKKNSSLAVFGTGGIGASALLAAKMKNCHPLIALDVSDTKLQFAKRLGASHLMNLKEVSFGVAFKKIAADGVDYAIEASGTASAMELAFEAIKNSGTAVIAGNLRHSEKISLDPFGLIKGKKIIGTWGGGTDPDKDIPIYVRAYLKGEMPIQKLITHRFRLGDINAALRILESGQAGRIIIEL